MPVLEAAWVKILHVREVAHADGAAASAGEQDAAAAAAVGGGPIPKFETEVEFAVLPRSSSARSVSLRDVSEVRAHTSTPTSHSAPPPCTAFAVSSHRLFLFPPTASCRPLSLGLHPPQQIENALADPSLPLRSKGTWGPLIDPFDLLRVSEHRVTSRSIDEKGGNRNSLPVPTTDAAARAAAHVRMQVVTNAAATVAMSSVATALLALAVLTWHHRERSRRAIQRWSVS